MLAIALVLAFIFPPSVQTQSHVTTPEAFFGQPVGADYFLATWDQLVAYWERLDAESDRMVLQTIGLTEEGRPQHMAIITSPENHRDLEHYRSISAQLAGAQGVTESIAKSLAAEGKAVVWIDGGLHATEVLGAQQLIELVYHMTSSEDPETLRILDDVILLAVHANPDGHFLVANWYMRSEDPLERSTSMIPTLYHKYAGHDNNRDFYMLNLAESRNMARIQYLEWFPQIIYNHHQTGPAGTIMFAPPYRDPPNHNLDPLMITSIDQVGAAMHARFVREGKGGTTMRSGASYSTWWNGGLRTTPYFKNMIGLLTETIGNPTPIEVPFLPERQISSGALPLPVEPGVWHFRQSVDYSMTADLAVLDYASRNRDALLFNIWRMGMNAIERGNHDSWTPTPDWVEAAAEGLERGRGDRADWEAYFRNPDMRDPRSYIIPADQPDFPTATKFVNILRMGGVEVEVASADFRVGTRSYPAGSFVVKTAQAFRPHVLDMFEPQNHPDDFAYPGAPPTRPYDSAGWTLAYQMGIQFDRILDGFDGPFEPIEDLAPVSRGSVGGVRSPSGWLFSHQVNDAIIVVNRLLREGREVYWITQAFESGGTRYPAGSFYVAEAGGLRTVLEHTAQELGLHFTGIADAPSGNALRLRPVRIGLWDQYGGSMPSGWVRYMLEQFEFDFEVVYPPQLDTWNLSERFDVLIFPSGAIPSAGGRGGGGSGRGGGRSEEMLASIPEPYRERIGSVTAETTIPRLLDFARNGGSIIALEGSTNLGFHAGLPISSHMVTMEGGEERPLRSQEYYIPTSILQLRLEHVSPLTQGMGDRLDVMFSNSPVFTLGADAAAAGVRRIGWFDTGQPLRSGWAWGQEYLEGGTTLLEADYGSGRLFLFGPQVTFRAQPHASFPLIFNAVYYGTARTQRIR